jgi:hypothetical protein
LLYVQYHIIVITGTLRKPEKEEWKETALNWTPLFLWSNDLRILFWTRMKKTASHLQG